MSKPQSKNAIAEQQSAVEVAKMKKMLTEAGKRIDSDLFGRANSIRQIYSSRVTHDAFANDQLRIDTADLIKELMQAIWDAKGALRSQDAKAAADAVHGQPGGSRDKRAKIVTAWETGKYKTKTECATKEHDKIGISFSTAIKALRNK